jgi:CRISPR-associated protein Cas5h
MIDCEEAKLLADSLIKKKCMYIPYLGTNDHPADIKDVKIINGNKIETTNTINSLFYKDKVVLGDAEEADEAFGYVFKYEEYLPVELEENFNNYVTKPLVHTNIFIQSYSDDIYTVDNNNIVFL